MDRRVDTWLTDFRAFLLQHADDFGCEGLRFPG
jgi:hypothetical protein